MSTTLNISLLKNHHTHTVLEVNNNLPSVARSVIQSVSSGRAVNPINSQLTARVVLVPELLKSHEVLLGNVGRSSVIEVHGVVAGVGVRPAVVVQSAQPVIVARGVHRAAALVVTRTRLSCQTDLAPLLQVHVVEHVLLGGRSEGGIQRDIVVL